MYVLGGTRDISVPGMEVELHRQTDWMQTLLPGGGQESGHQVRLAEGQVSTSQGP